VLLGRLVRVSSPLKERENEIMREERGEREEERREREESMREKRREERKNKLWPLLILVQKQRSSAFSSLLFGLYSSHLRSQCPL